MKLLSPYPFFLLRIIYDRIRVVKTVSGRRFLFLSSSTRECEEASFMKPPRPPLPLSISLVFFSSFCSRYELEYFSFVRRGR